MPSTVATAVEINATTTEFSREFNSCSLPSICSYHRRENPPHLPTLSDPEKENTTTTNDGQIEEGEHQPSEDGEKTGPRHLGVPRRPGAASSYCPSAGAEVDHGRSASMTIRIAPEMADPNGQFRCRLKLCDDEVAEQVCLGRHRGCRE